MENNFFRGFFLMESPPISAFLLLFGYLLLVFQGPKFMEKRAPFKLDRIMIFYNYLQVVANGVFTCVVSLKILNFIL